MHTMSKTNQEHLPSTNKWSAYIENNFGITIFKEYNNPDKGIWRNNNYKGLNYPIYMFTHKDHSPFKVITDLTTDAFLAADKNFFLPRGMWKKVFFNLMCTYGTPVSESEKLHAQQKWKKVSRLHQQFGKNIYRNYNNLVRGWQRTGTH